MEGPVRDLIEEALATRSYVRPAELEGVRSEVASLRNDLEATRARTEAAHNELASLRKKINMAMGAIQAATAQLADLRRTAEDARTSSAQATQAATSATATAEALADGVSQVEDQLAGLVRRLGAAPATADLSALELSVPAFREHVESGAADAVLHELLAAERAGKARKGAIAAIEKRIADPR